MKRKRYLTGEEHLLLQGFWPWTYNGPQACAMQQLFQDSGKYQRERAGNAFSTTVALAACLASLATCSAWYNVAQRHKIAEIPQRMSQCLEDGDEVSTSDAARRRCLSLSDVSSAPSDSLRSKPSSDFISLPKQLSADAAAKENEQQQATASAEQNAAHAQQQACTADAAEKQSEQRQEDASAEQNAAHAQHQPCTADAAEKQSEQQQATASAEQNAAHAEHQPCTADAAEKQSEQRQEDASAEQNAAHAQQQPCTADAAEKQSEQRQEDASAEQNAAHAQQQACTADAAEKQSEQRQEDASAEQNATHAQHQACTADAAAKENEQQQATASAEQNAAHAQQQACTADAAEKQSEQQQATASAEQNATHAQQQACTADAAEKQSEHKQEKASAEQTETRAWQDDPLESLLDAEEKNFEMLEFKAAKRGQELKRQQNLVSCAFGSAQRRDSKRQKTLEETGVTAMPLTSTKTLEETGVTAMPEETGVTAMPLTTTKTPEETDKNNNMDIKAKETVTTPETKKRLFSEMETPTTTMQPSSESNILKRVKGKQPAPAFGAPKKAPAEQKANREEDQKACAKRKKAKKKAGDEPEEVLAQQQEDIANDDEPEEEDHGEERLKVREGRGGNPRGDSISIHKKLEAIKTWENLVKEHGKKEGSRMFYALKIPGQTFFLSTYIHMYRINPSCKNEVMVQCNMQLLVSNLHFP